MSDPEVLRAHGEVTGQKPSWAKQFLASGKGQFAAQMGMMMMPWDKVLEPMGLQDSAVGSVLPLAAFMGAPGLMAKYTGAGKARAALGQNMMAGKWTPPAPMVKTQSSDKLFEVKQIVVSTPGVVTAHG
jgi:O-glycosyl hydrolase